MTGDKDLKKLERAGNRRERYLCDILPVMGHVATAIDEGLKGVPHRNMDITRDYYIEGSTLKELGLKYNLTDERVRQLVRVVSYKLRNKYKQQE